MKCCICGKEIEGYGNNPWPVNQEEDARCCDDCNWSVVIPARIEDFIAYEAKMEMRIDEEENTPVVVQNIKVQLNKYDAAFVKWYAERDGISFVEELKRMLYVAIEDEQMIYRDEFKAETGVEI